MIWSWAFASLLLYSLCCVGDLGRPSKHLTLRFWSVAFGIVAGLAGLIVSILYQLSKL